MEDVNVIIIGAGIVGLAVAAKISEKTKDVYILENTFSNKVAELKRDAQWRWGDMETVRQFFLKKFAAGRKTHLYVLLRGLIGDLNLSIWLIGTIIGSLIPGLMLL